MGMAAILVIWPGLFEHTLFPYPKEKTHEIWFWLAKWFLRRGLLKIDGRWTTDDWTKVKSGTLVSHVLIIKANFYIINFNSKWRES